MSETEGIHELVSGVLNTLPEPYGEDVTEDVFLSIEQNHAWQERYDELVSELGKDTVNQWIGKYTKQITGLRNPSQVAAKRSRLTESYSKLVSIANV